MLWNTATRIGTKALQLPDICVIIVCACPLFDFYGNLPTQTPNHNKNCILRHSKIVLPGCTIVVAGRCASKISLPPSHRASKRWLRNNVTSRLVDARAQSIYSSILAKYLPRFCFALESGYRGKSRSTDSIPKRLTSHHCMHFNCQWFPIQTIRQNQQIARERMYASKIPNTALYWMHRSANPTRSDLSSKTIRMPSWSCSFCENVPLHE